MHQLSNILRFLAIDMVETASSGHPGMPMGMSDIATILFKDFLCFNPNDPYWPNRDRLILSAGHGSALLYSALFLAGYKGFALKDLKQFRQLGSKTPGHPEYDVAHGIETTTGPLGQGLANAVGMSISENTLRAKYGIDVINHKIYAIVGDGCLMEGISQESISLAGHLQLTNLIVIFDDNQISIDGKTSLATSEDQKMRFLANDWIVFEADGHDFRSITNALTNAQSATKPALIICKTKIGYGSPNMQETEGAHGAPLGVAEMQLTRQNLNWPHLPFQLPQELLDQWRIFWERNEAKYQLWQEQSRAKFEEYKNHSNLSTAIHSLERLKESYVNSQNQEATRKASGKAVDAIMEHYPALLGGSADLSLSNCTLRKCHAPSNRGNLAGNYIHYGVREHLMVAAQNGIALHGFFKPYGGTFLVFTDYCRPAIRLAAMMKLNIILVMTHDSIGLGEDGPTHQPVEHLATLRAIPNLLVLRPCDGAEVAESWQIALSDIQAPVMLVLSRQDLPQIRSKYSAINQSAAGGYIVRHESLPHAYTLVATGSEVKIALEVAYKLEALGMGARVMSMPCREIFLKQDISYRNKVLGHKKPVIVIEAALKLGWEVILGSDGLFFGMDGFGASGKADDLYEHFGLTSDKIFHHLRNNHVKH